MTVQDACPLPTELIAATRAELHSALHLLSDLRQRTVTPTLVDELASARYRALRLGHCLERLEQEGLLAVVARRLQSPTLIVKEALRDVRDECERRQITLDVELDAKADNVWLDPDQLDEALRCVLDEGMTRIGRGGMIRVRTRGRRESHVITITHDGSAPGDELAPRILAQIAATSRTAITTREEDGWVTTVIRLANHDLRIVAAEVPVQPTCRRWVFPAPTAA